VSKWDISKPQRGERVVLTHSLKPEKLNRIYRSAEALRRANARGRERLRRTGAAELRSAWPGQRPGPILNLDPTLTIKYLFAP
jgi:hypothetical protein